MNNQHQDRRSEIDAFKALNLSVIASNYNYRIVKAKSTRHSVLMDSGNDKIIVSKNGNHYVYCSVYDPGSNGTAIDFVQKIVEPGCSLGRVRQLLRPYLDGAYFSTVLKKHDGQYAKSIRPSSTDFLAVAARYSGFEPITTHHQYLCTERGIPLALLQQDRLRGRVRHCPNRNSIIFPHWGSPSENGGDGERCITGYEIKGAGINMFSAEGRKGLWASAGFKHDRVLAVAESGLDALSYLALNEANNVRVVSLSGQINPYQPNLILSAIARMGQGTQIVAAFDNDEAGDRLTEVLQGIVRDCGRGDIEFRDDRPAKRGTDWNAVLGSVY